MALKPCRECGREVSTDAATCPNCGVKDPTKPAHRRIGCFGALMIIVALGVIANLADTSDGTPAASGAAARTEPSGPDLEVTSDEGVRERGAMHVKGTVVNRTSRTCGYVQVQVTLLKDGVVVGSTLDNVTNLGPGETWAFDAVSLNDDANQYRVASVTQRCR